MIEAPADLLDHADGSNYDERCQEDSPCWGWEGEGEQCRRKLGHDGPHYTEGPDFMTGGAAVIQWEVRPK